MTVHIEWTTGIARIYDQAMDISEPVEGFFAVLNISRIGPGRALLEADLSNHRLTRKNIIEVRRALVGAGFRLAYAWRHEGRTVPYGRNGRIVDTSDGLSLWEVDLLCHGDKK